MNGPRPLNHPRLLLVLLLSFSLLGVQLVQGSALHDHPRHTVDCALCHFQLSDDAEYGPQPHVFVAPRRSHVGPAAIVAAFDLAPAPYQSRAPPRV